MHEMSGSWFPVHFYPRMSQSDRPPPLVAGHPMAGTEGPLRGGESSDSNDWLQLQAGTEKRRRASTD
jgi:prephenate dehydrogenase